MELRGTTYKSAIGEYFFFPVAFFYGRREIAPYSGMIEREEDVAWQKDK
jgi:hypothetical protein